MRQKTDGKWVKYKKSATLLTVWNDWGDMGMDVKEIIYFASAVCYTCLVKIYQNPVFPVGCIYGGRCLQRILFSF